MNAQLFLQLYRTNFYVWAFFVLILSLCCFKDLDSLEYGLFAKNENSKPIKKLFVISERCSGSNFINSLILQNFQVIDDRIGHKHFPPWYELPLTAYTGNEQYYHFAQTEDFLFIIIFRDPYDWVRSFNQKPYHADSSLVHVRLDEFIRKPWILDAKNESVINQRFIHPFVDLDPKTGLPFENVLKLRTAKIKNMLQIKDRAPNVYYINYEIVRDHPKEVMEEIKNLFFIQANDSYKPVETYKGKGRKIYKAKKYAPLSPVDLKHINSSLDAKLEKRIGYILIDYPQQID